jgi:hypothetical protein
MDTTIHHTEQALRQHNQNEKTLRRYRIVILQELYTQRSIQVDVGDLRPLKKPYINALLTYVR